jgi:hypothetical protein
MVLPVTVLLGVFHYFPTLGNVIEQFILQRSAAGSFTGRVIGMYAAARVAGR